MLVAQAMAIDLMEEFPDSVDELVAVDIKVCMDERAFVRVGH